jgi:pentatricopeptide repeat protein
LRLRKTAPNPSDITTTEDTQGSQTSSGSQRGRKQDEYSSHGFKDKQASRTRSKTPSKASPGARVYQHRPNRDPESIRKAAEQRQKAKEREKKRRERYDQWGYLRHQYSGDELIAVKKQFDYWHANLASIVDGTKPKSLSWLDDGKFLFELESSPNMEEAWHELDVESRKQRWPRVMLSTLYSRPEKTIQVLEATLDPLPPGYAMAGVAHFCISALNLKDIKVMRDRVTKADEVLELFAKLIEDIPSGHVPFRQSTLGLLAAKLPIEQTAEIFQILQRSGIKLHKNTLLKFADKLARSHTHKEQAFQVLRSIADEGHDLNSPSIASVITTLLHTQPTTYTWSDSEDSFSPQRAMEYFLEHGFSPNLVSFTALIQSLCLQGDIEEAVRLPLLLAENGAELDSRCYTTVFRGAKSSLKASNIRRALDVARAAKVPHVDVLNNTLHSIFYFAEMESRDKRYPAPYVVPVFGPLLRIYAKKFDLEPLQWLLPDTLPLLLSQENMDSSEKFRSGSQREWEFRSTIVPVANEFFDGNDGPRRKPSMQTLATMVRGYIKTLHRPYDLMSFYTWFKSRLEERGTERNLAQQLVKEQGSIIHDTLILVMLERKVLLRPALQVFGDMLRDSLITKPPEEGKQEEVLTEDCPVHPPPNLFTFSILLHGLLMRREVMLAEQVRQALREHNLEPNIVTWNTLVKGYASMQDLSQTVGTLQDLEAAGYKPDMHTFKAFAKLKDQTRALEMMEKIIDENRKRLEEHQSQ